MFISVEYLKQQNMPLGGVLQEPNKHSAQEERHFKEVLTRYPDYKEIILFVWNKAKVKVNQLLSKLPFVS